MFTNKRPSQSQQKDRMWDVRMVRKWRWILWWCLYCLFLQQWAGGWQQRPGHACQKILMRECMSEDAEGRSGVVPLMVSARELKCIPLTAWERESTPVLRLRTDAPVPGGQWTSPPGVFTFKKTKKKKKPSATWACQFEACSPPQIGAFKLWLKLVFLGFGFFCCCCCCCSPWSCCHNAQQ